MATDTRIYCITPKGDDGISKARLVDAPNQAQALRHVAASGFDIKLASQQRLVALLKIGIEVEKAGEDPANPSN